MAIAICTGCGIGKGISNFSAGLRIICFRFHGRQVDVFGIGVGERRALTLGVVNPVVVSLEID